MCIGMLFETLGVGLIVPVLALMTQPDLFEHYPFLQPLLRGLGDPTQVQLVFGGMLALFGLYVLKTVFLVFADSKVKCNSVAKVMGPEN